MKYVRCSSMRSKVERRVAEVGRIRENHIRLDLTPRGPDARVRSTPLYVLPRRGTYRPRLFYDLSWLFVWRANRNRDRARNRSESSEKAMNVNRNS